MYVTKRGLMFTFLIVPLFGLSQLHHQTIGIGGGSTKSGVIFSVGQSSVIGNNFSSGFMVTQGFVQPISGLYSISDLETNLNANVYPNPFFKEFKVSFDKEYSNINIIVQTLLGQTVYKDSFKNKSLIKLDLSGFSGQTYIVTIYADSKRFTAKLIKND